MKKQLLGLLPCTFFSVSAMAQGMYLGVESSVVNVDYTEQFRDAYYGYTDTYNDDDFATAIKVIAGSNITPYFALEGFVGFGVMEATIGDEYGSFEIELDQVLGANAVGIIPLGRVVSLYGKLGAASIEYSDDSGTSVDDSGLSYGFGIKFNTGSVGAVIVDYAIYPDIEKTFPNVGYENKVTLETRMISAGYHFNL